MGLSGRKAKQRIPNDPRNLSWADNATKFGQKYLSNLGWDPSKGLGADGDGRTSHIKVSQKLDMLGIGAARANDPDGVAWTQNREFEAVLKRLNKEAERGRERGGGEEGRKRRRSTGGDGKKTKRRKEDGELSTDVVEDVASTPAAPVPRYMAARNVASKRLASKSAAAISEILGIAPSAAATPPASVLADGAVALETLTTSTKSVAEYFKERLGAGAGVGAWPEEGGALRKGLGMGAGGVGSLMAGVVCASEPVAVVLRATDSCETGEEGEERTEKKADKKKKKKKRAEKGDGSAPLDECDGREVRRREKKAKKEKRRQGD